MHPFGVVSYCINPYLLNMEKHDLALLIEEIVKETLEEMPIKTFQTVGDFSKRYSFKNKTDRAILSSPAGVQKIKRLFEKTDAVFNLYFLNSPKAGSEFQEYGIVTPEFVKEKFDVELPQDNEAISIVFIGNSAAERHMMTGWVIAHRIGHALEATQRKQQNNVVGYSWAEYVNELRSSVVKYLEEVYKLRVRMEPGRGTGDPKDRTYVPRLDQKSEKLLLTAMQQMGTFKSARENNVRNYLEFFLEVFAQYLITGKVKFNHLPERLLTAIGPWGHKQFRMAIDNATLQEFNENLEGIERTVEYNLDALLNVCHGKVFLM